MTSRSSVEHDSLWLYAIATLCNLCGHARVEVKLQALQALRKALLPTGTRPRSANVWKKCFSYLIPAIDGIDPVSTTGVGSGAGSGDPNVSRGGPASTTPAATHGARGRRTQHGDLKMGAATLVFQVFLHNLKELANMVDFHVFWLQFIGNMERYMRGGDMRPRQAQLRVHVIENFKNLLLVMVSGNVFVKSAERSGQDLLALTWTVIDSFRPDLCRQLKQLIQPPSAAPQGTAGAMARGNTGAQSSSQQSASAARV